MPDGIPSALAGAALIGTGRIDGPEGVLPDEAGNLYGGTRDGRMPSLSGPGFTGVTTLAGIGFRPLGPAPDAEGRILACPAGMGLVRVTVSGKVTLLADRTTRSLAPVQDDTALRMADGFGIAPGGVICFTGATRRRDFENRGPDLPEARPSVRPIARDPGTGRTRTACDNLIVPDGVRVTDDGRHLLVASAWTCSILILDLADMAAGPRAFISGLPGNLDIGGVPKADGQGVIRQTPGTRRTGRSP